MSARERAWAERRRAEGLLLSSLPRRARWRLYGAIALTEPRQLARLFRLRFLRWAALPGDRWECLIRNQIGEVVRSDRRGVLLSVANGEAAPPGWPLAADPRAIPSREYADDCWTPA